MNLRGIEKDSCGARSGEGSGGNDANTVFKYEIFKNILN